MAINVNYDFLNIPTEKVADVCPIHNCQKIKVKGSSMTPMCIKCEQEKVKKAKEKLVDDFKVNSVKRVFKDNSLFNQPQVDPEKTFYNWKAEKESKEAQIAHKAFDIAKEYILKPDEPIKTIMYGTPGEGKTHLALAMLNLINEKSNPPQKCLFLDVNELIDHINRSWDNPTARWTKDYALREIKQADVVVIDDLGSESAMRVGNSQATEFKQQFFKQVFDCQKRIIITSNLTVMQFKSVYNPKIVSRMFENSTGRRIDFTGITDKRSL